MTLLKCRPLKYCGTLILVAVCTALLSGCSVFTSIDREEDGRYVITGWHTPGPVGYVWICEYDEAAKTLRVKEVR